MKTVDLSPEEVEFLLGRLHVESECGPDVYSEEELKLMEDLKDKLNS